MKYEDLGLVEYRLLGERGLIVVLGSSLASLIWHLVPCLSFQEAMDVFVTGL